MITCSISKQKKISNSIVSTYKTVSMVTQYLINFERNLHSARRLPGSQPQWGFQKRYKTRKCTIWANKCKLNTILEQLICPMLSLSQQKRCHTCDHQNLVFNVNIFASIQSARSGRSYWKAYHDLHELKYKYFWYVWPSSVALTTVLLEQPSFSKKVYYYY